MARSLRPSCLALRSASAGRLLLFELTWSGKSSEGASRVGLARNSALGTQRVAASMSLRPIIRPHVGPKTAAVYTKGEQRRTDDASGSMHEHPLASQHRAARCRGWYAVVQLRW